MLNCKLCHRGPNLPLGGCFCDYGKAKLNEISIEQGGAMKFLRLLFNTILSDYQWYRRYKGGIWYNTTPYFAWYIWGWSRYYIKFFEHLNCIEDYTMKTTQKPKETP